MDNLSILSNVDDLEEAIKNSNNMYETKEDIINLDIIGYKINDDGN